MELQSTTPDIVGTSEVINTSDTCSKVESVQSIVAIIAIFHRWRNNAASL